MINKRDFLKTGASAIVGSAGATAAVAAVRPRLDERAGLASWQAHVGQRFEVDGHAVILQAATALPGRQPGEQFSLRFSGELPAGLGDGLHTLTASGGAGQSLYLARAPQGLRADFCRLQG
ncbi:MULTISPECIES: hypothetical protein [unclassified Roseateles]|uniref:DUF6916 family protein n=1 Tax=unclassified Roseateles TaxID=2626991 RepID=UPI0006FAECD1|nr:MULTISPECIES: hypothetical protein [unclassified Roseateles]KQW46371.1 hypothetical protein ASC81_08150 [Pelomonas sp. Root405]KRA73421.1 hypothetical protein ASD88_08150 [Pelomonas sp. Root662]